MPDSSFFRRRAAGTAALLALLVASIACGEQIPEPPTGAVDADLFLYERGMEQLEDRHWFQARQYFQRLVDTYPRSQYRPDAKLGIGDTYMGEGRVDSHILAAAEYREFLQFFPLHSRADYAQYQLAQSYVRQMHSSQRDQTMSRDALREIETFLRTYPNSPFRPEVEALERTTRDRLAEAEFRVGRFYHRQENWIGALLRFQIILDDYPNYSQMDEVYYHVAETYRKAGAPEEAVPFYQRVLNEFPESDYAEDATKRLAEIKR
jgi:outer membrane protein assembly factor BamD